MSLFGFRDEFHKIFFVNPQKPLSISQTKRNPFKKSSDSGKKSITNPLKHLTDSALGFDSEETDITTANGQADTGSSTLTGKENSNSKANPSVCIDHNELRAKCSNSNFNCRHQNQNSSTGSKNTRPNFKQKSRISYRPNSPSMRWRNSRNHSRRRTTMVRLQQQTVRQQSVKLIWSMAMNRRLESPNWPNSISANESK